MAEYSQTKAIKRHGVGWAVLPLLLCVCLCVCVCVCSGDLYGHLPVDDGKKVLGGAGSRGCHHGNRGVAVDAGRRRGVCRVGLKHLT